MALVSTAHVDKPFIFPVVSNFLHGIMDQTRDKEIDLANICGLVS